MTKSMVFVSRKKTTFVLSGESTGRWSRSVPAINDVVAPVAVKGVDVVVGSAVDDQAVPGRSEGRRGRVPARADHDAAARRERS